MNEREQLIRTGAATGRLVDRDMAWARTAPIEELRKRVAGTRLVVARKHIDERDLHRSGDK